MTQIQAAIFREVGRPLTVETVDIDAPGPNEVLVRTVATGVCHSDLHVVDGNSRFNLGDPIVLGHEGAGIVEAVGDDVTTVRPGDHVVGCLVGLLRQLRAVPLRPPQPLHRRLSSRRRASEAPRLSPGRPPLNQFHSVGSYAEKMLLHENSLVKIDADLPLDRAALVGCGVLTGVGAALRTAGCSRARRSRSSAAAASGCRSSRARASPARARSSPSTSSIRSWRWRRASAQRTSSTPQDDAVKTVRALTGGAASTTPSRPLATPRWCARRSRVLAIRGTATIVGVPPPDTVFEVPFVAMRPECKLQTSRMGSNQFRIDIPRYLEFYRQGRLLLDEMVSVRGKLGDVNEAFRAMKAGEVARTVLTFD